MFTKSTPCAGCHTGLSTDQHGYLSPVLRAARRRVDAKHVKLG